MRIESIYINNFRLLKDFKLDLEDTLSLVLGKNNTGKTSILTCLDKFINHSDKKKIVSEDFNLDYRKVIEDIVVNEVELTEDDYNKNIYGIKLRLVISYKEGDNTCNISDLMMDLEPDHNKIVLGYEFSLHFKDYISMRREYQNFKFNEENKEKECEEKEKSKPEEEQKKYLPKPFDYFFKRNVEKYFKYKYKSINYDYENLIIDESVSNEIVNKVNLYNILNFKYISAKRNVTNKDNEKTLSLQTSEIYERSEKNDEDEKKIEEFNTVIEDTDEILGNVYEGLFSDITEKVSLFGGIKKNESIIKIISSLQRRELLKGNTTVIYKHNNDSEFPEHYNGLGYMNLISMIFEIEILVSEFKRGKDENPADINLLFIEEPEAHTHPQMQYVFIKNITELLKDGISVGKNSDGKTIKSQPFQYVISTHSSHIVANCQDFNSIKYLKKETINDIKAKNLKDLEKEYNDAGEEKNYRFLKQYLTLNRAELFFADKAIFIEGDTERILLPAMMKKLDIEIELEENELSLLSQNISIVEVGAHSHIFERFIDFIGVKSIILTDLDCYYTEPVLNDEGIPQIHKNGNLKVKEIKCPASHNDVQFTKNWALIFFHKEKKEINYFKELNFDWKIIRRNKKGKWNSNRKGKILLTFQIEESGYHARSFEDGFFHINYDFMCDKNNSFQSLTDKCIEDFKANKKAFELSENGIESKSSLAIEILLNSDETYSNWQIPAYIKEGLLWLRRD
jgi:putative ATP-dependent endonuclease of the OLD family